MEVTKLIVEYLVGGTLMVISTVFALASWFPNDMERLTNPLLTANPTNLNEVFLGTIFLALAYGFGIISEYIGDVTFQKKFTQIKNERIVKYLDEHRSTIMLSPIFRTLAQQPKDERNKGDLGATIGKMRFFVMNYSERLYTDIAQQISRFRLIRVLFLVEVISTVAILGKIIHEPSIFWIVMLILNSIILRVNYKTIESRFNRYCRAIERAFLILMEERNDEAEKFDCHISTS